HPGAQGRGAGGGRSQASGDARGGHRVPVGRAARTADGGGRGAGGAAARPGGPEPEAGYGRAGARTHSPPCSGPDRLTGAGALMTREEAETVLTAAGQAEDGDFPLLEAAIACAIHDYPFRNPQVARTLGDNA